MVKFDLHFHSTYSDGKLSIPELASIIRRKKLKFCSLADHNSIDGIRELETSLNGSGVKVIPSVELTAKYGDNEVHISAYDFDIDEATVIVRERNEIVRRQKVEEMNKAIHLSLKAGLEITHALTPSEKQPVAFTTALNICANHSN